MMQVEEVANLVLKRFNCREVENMVATGAKHEVVIDGISLGIEGRPIGLLRVWVMRANHPLELFVLDPEIFKACLCRGRTWQN